MVAAPAQLARQASDTLRQRILAGAFGGEGELPSQGDLCGELGVSRSVVREAMRMLETQGLVETSQGRRPRVRPVDAGAVADSVRLLLARGSLSLGQLVELRRPLESEIAAMAARRATPALLDQLRQSVLDLERAKRLADQAAADRRFHELLADATGNPLFTMILAAVTELLDESRMRTIGKVGPGPALAGHRAILSAVAAGDADAARAAMLRHVDEAGRDLWQAGGAVRQPGRTKPAGAK